jgi:hypothetical protein
VITCEVGTGGLLLPPSPEEALFGLGTSRVRVVSPEGRDELLALAAVGQRVVEQLMRALSQKQEAIANFAPTRHLERVERKLRQLAREHGHVVHDGIRIDFPVSHALLAEMIEVLARDSHARGPRAATHRRRGSSRFDLLAPRLA